MTQDAGSRRGEPGVQGTALRVLVSNAGPAAEAPRLEAGLGGGMCVGWAGWGAMVCGVMGTLGVMGPSLLQDWTWLMSLTCHIVASQVSSPSTP